MSIFVLFCSFFDESSFVYQYLKIQRLFLSSYDTHFKMIFYCLPNMYPPLDNKNEIEKCMKARALHILSRIAYMHMDQPILFAEMIKIIA